MTFIDLNTFLYAIFPGPDDRAKAEKARDILRRDDLAVSVQVLQDFYVQATRVTSTAPIPEKWVSAISVEKWVSAILFWGSPSSSFCTPALSDRE